MILCLFLADWARLRNLRFSNPRGSRSGVIDSKGVCVMSKAGGLYTDSKFRPFSWFPEDETLFDMLWKMIRLGYWYWCPETSSGGWSQGVFGILELDSSQTRENHCITSLFSPQIKAQIEKAFKKIRIDPDSSESQLFFAISTPSSPSKQISMTIRPRVFPNDCLGYEGFLQDVSVFLSLGADPHVRPHHFQDLLGFFPDLLLIVDFQGTIMESAFCGPSPTLFPSSFVADAKGKSIGSVFPDFPFADFSTFALKGIASPVFRQNFQAEDPERPRNWECMAVKLSESDRILVMIRNVSHISDSKAEKKIGSSSLQKLLETAPFPVIISGVQDERIRYCNPKTLQDFGISKDQLIGKSVRDFYLHLEERRHFLDLLYSKGSVADQEISLRNLDGSARSVLLSASLTVFGKEPCVIISINDISNRQKMEEQNRISEERYRFIAENTQDVIWVYRPKEDRFTFVSPSIHSLRGISAEQAMQESLSRMVSPDFAEVIRNEVIRGIHALEENRNGPASLLFEVQQPTADGKRVWVEISAKIRLDASGEVEIIGVSRNIQQRKKTENEVLYLSSHDQLTGLYNRRYYEEELKRVDMEDNLPLTLIMADVNGLKLTNDAFGHSAGDKILKTFADILTKETRPADVVARVGGDEFVIILKRTESSEAEKLVLRISDAISEKQMVRAILSVSFGWKTKSTMSESIEDVYKQSEDDMYRNKLFSGSSLKNDILNLIRKSLFGQNSIEQSHAESVSELCRKTGAAIGLKEDDVKELGLAGLLHDIGKIAIPESILMKNGVLTEAEMNEVRRHPEIGYQILRSVSDFSDIARFVLDHHERMNGSGYPRGLRGDEISTQAKIIGIAEAYDSMVRKMPYRKARSKETAILELQNNSGTCFDPAILEVFIDKVLLG